MFAQMNAHTVALSSKYSDQAGSQEGEGVAICTIPSSLKIFSLELFLVPKNVLLTVKT